MSELKILIIGCGYVSSRVASLEHAAGRVVVCLARTEYTAKGYQMVTGDLDRPNSLDLLAIRAAILYYFAPPPNAGTGDPRLAALLRALDSQNPPGRVVYVSTSGVYGNCHGAWVSESRPANPQSERAMRRWAAETMVRDWCAQHGTQAVVLRVPGIYGPGRLPIERIRQASPVVRRDESPFSNRIHVDDLACACVAAAHSTRIDALYNVSDGHPTTMTDYIFRVADVLGLARPPEISLAEARGELSSGMLSFLEESRRLENGKMLRDLGVALRYSDLDRGLEASLAD